jgi:hypothetical protein
MNPPEEPVQPVGEIVEERELCRTCLTPNPPGAAFCRDCGAPLSSYASTAPFESVFAEGHVYRSAVERPHKPVVLAGVWLQFGGIGLVGAITLYFGLTSAGPLEMLMGIVILAVSATVLCRATWNYFKQRRKPAPAAPVAPSSDAPPH